MFASIIRKRKRARKMKALRSHFLYIDATLNESTDPIRRHRGSIVFVYTLAMVSGRKRQIREGKSMSKSITFKNDLGFMF
jgi:hypothetical protein